MNNLSIIISVITALCGILAFFIARYNEAKKEGEKEAQISATSEKLRTEIDTRVKSVCDKHDSDIKMKDLELSQIKKDLESHIRNNDKEHEDLFHKMNSMAKDISEIKTGVAVLVARHSEDKK